MIGREGPEQGDPALQRAAGPHAAAERRRAVCKGLRRPNLRVRWRDFPPAKKREMGMGGRQSNRAIGTDCDDVTVSLCVCLRVRGCPSTVSLDLRPMPYGGAIFYLSQ